jgi:hypothetical protein
MSETRLICTAEFRKKDSTTFHNAGSPMSYCSEHYRAMFPGEKIPTCGHRLPFSESDGCVVRRIRQPLYLRLCRDFGEGWEPGCVMCKSPECWEDWKEKAAA